MSQRWEPAIVCWLLSLLQFAIAMLVMAEDFRFPSQLVFEAQSNRAILVDLALAMANDILIAAGLTYFLHKNRSGLAKSDRIVNKIIRFTIRACDSLQTSPRSSRNSRDRIAYQHACSDHAYLGE